MLWQVQQGYTGIGGVPHCFKKTDRNSFGGISQQEMPKAVDGC